MLVRPWASFLRGLFACRLKARRKGQLFTSEPRRQAISGTAPIKAFKVLISLFMDPKLETWQIIIGFEGHLRAQKRCTPTEVFKNSRPPFSKPGDGIPGRREPRSSGLKFRQQVHVNILP
jgi:hypothetical protein